MSATISKNLVLSRPSASVEGEVPIRSLHVASSQDASSTTFRIEIPGVDPSTVDVECDNNSLIVTSPIGGATIPLDPTSDTSKIEANILWGMLTLKIPLPQQPAAHAIKVSVLDSVKKAPASTRSVKEFTPED
jgi:HSP20 family molecular chaperone IbpA